MNCDFPWWPQTAATAAAMLVCSCLAGADSPASDSAAMPELPGNPDNSLDNIDRVDLCTVTEFVLGPRCAGCHRAGGQAPDLTFAAAQSQLVGAESPSYPGTALIVPGDADASLLFRKIVGTQGSDQGGRMPPGTALDEARIALVEQWINDGAATDCSAPPPSVPERFHPAGWAAPALHGAALKGQELPCRSCHGDDLQGGVGPSCDSCHQQNWRADCTFCHGGQDNDSGAPPRDLAGTIAREQLTFRAHTEHVSVRNHRAYDCIQCHVKPTDVLTPGHIFDDTPGRAEVRFVAGLSAAGIYEGEGRCSNLYCHGTGRNPGAYQHTRPRPDCNGCHPGITAGREGWGTMSGEHEKHLREGITCADCHADTAATNGTEIVGPALHVNGGVDVVFANDSMEIDNRRVCSGTCHGEQHRSRIW